MITVICMISRNFEIHGDLVLEKIHPVCGVGLSLYEHILCDYITYGERCFPVLSVIKMCTRYFAENASELFEHENSQYICISAFWILHSFS